MGKSASSSKDSDSFQKASTMLKEACDCIIVGFSKKQGTFEYDPALERYMNDEMKVVRVTRYLEPMKAKGYGFGHEFLVVDLRTPEDCQLLIRAEKQFIGRNHEKYPPGGRTTVKRIADPPVFVRENKDGAKYAIDLQVEKILMQDFISILSACDRCYSLWKHNCWKYAYDTLRNLLEKFAGLADTSDICKEKIREALEKMPRPSLPAEILVEARCVFLGLSVAGALIYGCAVGGIAAFNFIQGLKMAQATGTVVEGLAGSSLLMKSSMDAAIGCLPKLSKARRIFASIGTGRFLLAKYDLMREKHGV